MYGPTTGDKIRLGDTDLFAEVERDFTVYGDECVFGGGKVLRDGMGQACGYAEADCLDTVITNALIIDYTGIFKQACNKPVNNYSNTVILNAKITGYTGIFKADIGIKAGLIVSLGKVGNPDIMDGVFDNMIIGVHARTCFFNLPRVRIISEVKNS